MPRGGHKVKPAKVVQIEPTAAIQSNDGLSTSQKSASASSRWRTSISAASFLSRAEVGSSGRPALTHSMAAQPTQVPAMSINGAAAVAAGRSLEGDSTVSTAFQGQNRPRSVMSATPSTAEDDIGETPPIPLGDLMVEETESNISSSYSRDGSSVFTPDSASIYSGRTSISGFDDNISPDIERLNLQNSSEIALKEGADSRVPNALQMSQRDRAAALRRQDTQDVASQEKNSLAKKAALFKNSRLRPQLPVFSTSLPNWSLICRALQAAQDCYDSNALIRRGNYTAADSSKDIKAMIVDDQLIDAQRVVFVAIRGTEVQSLTDWAVNKAAKPVRPVGLFDDVENACHAGFVQVTKAMIAQVASQLKEHPACAGMPDLLFTGHSAGGAVAAMLYSHMLSTTMESELTSLTSQFRNINCVTFGAPPLSLTPLPRRTEQSSFFLSIINEGDPVVRMSDASYVKSLAKLLTASPPPSVAVAVAPPPVKVVRGSRGATVYRQALPAAPPVPWEELPLWPTPTGPLANAGDVILLRDRDNGSASASNVTPEDLKDAIFADLAQHTTDMYVRRINEVALAAMIGRDVD